MIKFELGDAVEFYEADSSIKHKGVIVKFLKNSKAKVREYLYHEDRNDDYKVELRDLNFQ